MLSLFRYITRTLIWLLILAGLIVAGLRLTLANVGLFRADIETWVSHELVPGISFGDIRCYWNGIDPILELEKTAITLPDHRRPIAIDVLSIQFDLWDSLVLGTPVVLEMVGSVEKLVIRKDSDKQWWLNDISLIASESGDAFGDLEDWLSSIPHFMQLEFRRMIIEDDSRQRIYHINNVLVDIQHHEQVTHVQLSASLPDSLGGELNLRSLLEGDEGLVYLQSERIKLSPIADLLGLSLKDYRRVELAGQVWINLQKHHISDINGTVQINKASYQPKLDEVAIPFQFTMGFSAQKQSKYWHLSNHIEKMFVSDKNLPDLDMQLRVIPQPDGKQIQGWIESIDIPSYSGLLGSYLPGEYKELVGKSDLQGSVGNIWLQLPMADPSRIKVSAQLENLKSSRVELFPGIDQLDAEVVYANHQARLELSSNHLTVDFGDQFRAPFQIDSFVARAELGYSGDEFMLSISDLKAENQDIRVGGRVWMESDLRSSPFMSLHLEFDQGIASRKSNYLPVKLLPQEALEWIDDGIRAGDISNGNLLYHGRLQSIDELDEDKSGELYAYFDLKNAEVQFDADWAIAKQAQARLRFHNMGVNIEIDSVNYDSVEKARASIQLPTYANTSINADIHAVADTGKALETWLASPVGEQYRSIASNFQHPSGVVKANIKLFLPLEDEKQKEDVRVKIQLDNAAMQAPAWGVELSKAQGLLTVTGDSIKAKGIKALFYNDPVEIDVNTDQSNQQTLIKASGLIDTAQLLNLLPESLIQGIEGRSQWNVNLAIANSSQTGTSPALIVKAKSNLQGTSIYLPAPYSKESTNNRQIAGNLVLQGNEDILFNTQYGPYAKIRGRVEKSNNQDYQLVDLDLAFSTPLKTRQVSGIHLYGQLEKLPLDEWIVLHQTEKARQKTGSRSLMPLLQSIDLEVQDIALFGRKLSSVDFQVQQSEAGFSGNIQSREAKGKFYFPWQNSVQNPAIITMDYLHVATRVGPESLTNWVPGDFFNARFRSKVFSYGGKEVDDLEVDTSIDGEFLLIDTLTFKHNRIRFDANGYWLYSRATKIHDSFLALTVKGREFGQTIAALGFGDTIHNGEIKFSGELEWPGPIMDPNWDIVRGKGRLKLKDGILKDVEPGSGRFVGLFSLSALPRRLALDFSDVLFDGLEFDEIKGNMELKGQSLYTRNMKLDGPAAEVKIVGRTGMRDRDYDQKIYVVPKIRYALPVIGSIAAGSTVGWALLLLQNLLKSPIDESIKIEYSLTGSWDDPVITALNEPRRETKKTPKRTGNFEK
ncbi:MAG: TIGR02099 family protein [Gammaproteobacteria bacterium]|nr:TIGR02099 family protein [Gammaproteobacteria bacterium]